MAASELTPFGKLIDSVADNVAVIVMTTANLKAENRNLSDLTIRDIDGIQAQCVKLMNKLHEYGNRHARS